MRPRFCFLLVGVSLAAQDPAIPFEGSYRFVQLEIAASGLQREVRNLGGTLTFDASGDLRIAAEMGSRDGSAAASEGQGRFRFRAAENELILSNPSRPATDLRARVNTRSGQLLGSGATSGEDLQSILVGLRTPDRPASNALLQGEYTGVYMLVRDGKGSGLATGLFDLTADGKGQVTSLALIGHASGIDDVNRKESGSTSWYSIRSDGTGTIAFPAPSDVLKGECEIFVSGDGAFWIGYSKAAGQRDILVAIRKPPEGARIFRDLFWMSELYAENEFVFRPDNARFSSALGWIRSDSSARGFLSQWVNQAGRRFQLQTTNQFRLWSSGSMLGAAAVSGLTNFAVSLDGDTFIGAQVGMEGDLTLEHGIFVGIRSAAPATVTDPSIPVLASPGFVNTASGGGPALGLAPGALYSLLGTRLAPASASASDGALPSELAGVRVLVNGETAPLGMVSPEQINFQAPANFAAANAQLQLDNKGNLSPVLELPVSVTSPAVFTSNRDGSGVARAVHPDSRPVDATNPAVPGQTLILYASGLGSLTPEVAAGKPAPPDPVSRLTDGALRVLFDGKPAEILSAGALPGAIGMYQIKVTLPDDLVTARPVAVAITTSDAVADLAELPMKSR